MRWLFLWLPTGSSPFNMSGLFFDDWFVHVCCGETTKFFHFNAVFQLTKISIGIVCTESEFQSRIFCFLNKSLIWDLIPLLISNTFPVDTMAAITLSMRASVQNAS